jgi:hypothetical protein
VHLVQVKIRKPFARIPRDYCIFIFMFLGRWQEDKILNWMVASIPWILLAACLLPSYFSEHLMDYLSIEALEIVL